MTKNICIKCKEREAEYCTECHGIERMAIVRQFKKQVWKKANDKCEMCSENDKRCLTVHHLNREKYPYDPKKSQLLCMNCHWGKVHGFKKDDRTKYKDEELDEQQ